MSTSFGDFLREKRKERNFTVRILSKLIGKSASYISQLENGTRQAPKQEILEKLSAALVLNKSEKEKFLDLAAQSRKTLPDDLTEYVNSHKEVKEALRLSKRRDIPEDEWQSFLNTLKNKFIF